jgi:DNA-binding CsgD family transcriptional regulator
MPSPRGRQGDPVTGANGSAVQLRQLMRTLITVTAANEQVMLGDPSSAENVLVDTELDGMRYLLIRMPGAEHNRAALSPRELEIVRMVAQGHQNKTIAGILNISTWTVCAHVRRIFAKLGVSSRAAMVARLLQNNALAKPASAPGSGEKRGRAGFDTLAHLADVGRSSPPAPNRPTTKRRNLDVEVPEPPTVQRATRASVSYKGTVTA